MMDQIPDDVVEAALARYYAGLPLADWPVSARDDMRAALQAAAKGWAVPEGWKLVPVEPTHEMRLAADKVDYEHFISKMPGHASPQAASVDAVYRAMLNAAPDWMIG